MDQAFIPAVAALAGYALGALGGIITTSLTLHAQEPRLDGARATLEGLGVAEVATRAPGYAKKKQALIDLLIAEGRFEAFPDAVRFADGLHAAGRWPPDFLDPVNARGVAATREVVALLAGEAILDIGSGTVDRGQVLLTTTGVDITAAVCDAAKELNAACNMVEKVQIFEGSATALPLPDAHFDRDYFPWRRTSIADKTGFCGEAFRVLKPGGRLVLFQHNAGPNGTPDFPLPWAAFAEDSFLMTDEETRRDLAAVGFEIQSFRDTTQENFTAQTELRRQLQMKGGQRSACMS